ncbi:hypothetical protein CBL21_25335, partial [Shigella flexneri]
MTGKALFMVLRSQRPPAGLIHHSDRGSQYCAYDYRVIQEQFGLKTSGFAPIFPDICYHLTHYKPAAADIPVASDNPAH